MSMQLSAFKTLFAITMLKTVNVCAIVLKYCNCILVEIFLPKHSVMIIKLVNPLRKFEKSIVV